MRDIYSNCLALATLTPAARTASANGTTVDRNEDDCMFQDALVVISSGTVTDGSHTFEVQESDASASGFTAVADADLEGTEPVLTTDAADDDAVFEIQYKGGKRYIRVITTVSGTTTGGVYGALVVLSNPRRAPVVRD